MVKLGQIFSIVGWVAGTRFMLDLYLLLSVAMKSFSMLEITLERAFQLFVLSKLMSRKELW